MPRHLDPDLRDCLERANPYVHLHVELSAPNVQRVLRRASDQFLLSPVPQVSLAPAAGLQAYQSGAVGIVASALQVASFASFDGHMTIVPFDPSIFFHGLAWKLDPEFGRAVIRKFRAQVFRQNYVLGHVPRTRLELQVYRVRGVPGIRVRTKTTGGTVTTVVEPFIHYAFAPLLNPAPIIPDDQWANAPTWTEFDLRPWNLTVDTADGDIVRAFYGDQSWDIGREMPTYYFVIRALDIAEGDTTRVRWRFDNTSSPFVAGVGTFSRREWSRPAVLGGDQWYEQGYNDRPLFQLDIEAFNPPAAAANVQAVYVIDLGAVPSAESTGRIVFERSQPSGTTITVELSTAGSGGPWTVVKHGDLVAVKQQTYHLRVTWTPSAGDRYTPLLTALGIEFRVPFDVSAEAIVQVLPKDIAAPWLQGSIGSAPLKILRTGLRDYSDIATILASEYAPTKLEADIYLASKHPSVTRDKWFLLDRALISDRPDPRATSETFTLMSYAARLKRVIPRKVEQAPSSVHIVDAGSTTSVVKVKVGTPLIATPYATMGYHMRVQRTASALMPVGYVQTITGSVSTTDLTFAETLPDVLADGDIVEVHSAIYSAEKLSWRDADPADVWTEIIETRLAIPPERVGFGGIGGGGQSGRPLTLAERFPGDVTTQNKHRITGQLEEEEDAYEVLDQISFLAGGGTTEIAGQIVFVQVYPQLSAALVPAIPLPAVAAVFDPRDYYNHSFPPGLEGRASVVTGDFGVDKTSALADATPSKTTSFIDVDAVDHLTRQELEAFSAGTVPEEISRWAFNSYDGGLALMATLARQVGLATSTGLRQWTWTSIEQKPDLVPGDLVVIMTDEYTDYNPSTREPIRGFIAVQAILLGVGGGGFTFRAFVLGLNGNVIKVRGGTLGSLAGAGAPIEVPSDFNVSVEVVPTETGGVPEISATYTQPDATPFFDHMEYEVQQQRTGDGIAWVDLPTRVEQGGRAGADRIKADWAMTYRVTPVTVSSGGTRVRGTGALIKEIETGFNPDATPVVGAPVAYSDRIEYPLTFDVVTVRIEVWFTEYTASPGAATSRYRVGTLGHDLHRGSGTSQTLTIPLGAPTNYIVVELVCFDALDRMGQRPLVGPTQGAAPAVPPDITAAPTEVSDTAETTTVDVTMPAAGLAAGDDILVYRDGAHIQTVARTAGAGAAQTIVHTGLNPSTSYAWKYKLRNVGGFASTNYSPTLNTTTDPGVVPTPSVTISAYDEVAQGGYCTITPGANTPAGVTWRMQGNTDGGAFGGFSAPFSTLTPFHGHGQVSVVKTCRVKVKGEKAGWSDSATSAQSNPMNIPPADEF